MKAYTCISYHSSMSTRSFSWLHISGMLQWVENKEESNQSAINTQTLQTRCWVLLQSSNLPVDSAVSGKIQFSLCPLVHVEGQRHTKSLLKKKKKDEWEGESALLLSYDPAISTRLLFGSEVVLRVPYFKSPPTDLRRQWWRYFTHRLKQDVDFSIEGTINDRPQERRRIKQSLPGKLHLALLAHFSRATFVIYKFTP